FYHSTACTPTQLSFPTRRSSDLAAAARCRNAEQIAFVEKELRNRRTKAAFRRRARIYGVGAETACFATGQSFGGESLPCTTGRQDRKSTRLNSSHVKISYAVFCL